MRKSIDFSRLINSSGLFFFLIVLIFSTTIFRSFAQKPAEVGIVTENRIGSRYALSLEAMSVAGFDGLHSFAAAQLGGKWVLIGGRTDGLHRRQPFASFAPSGFNTNIFVIEPETQKLWRAPVAGLSAALREQLSATNMQFIQRNATLYLVGGYGYSQTAGDHLTHDKLTAVRLDCLIPAVEKGEAAGKCFRQIADPLFAVTGGQIGRLDDVYYLVGGQNFEGRYNPMGPDHGPGFFQKYTEQIRKFRILDDRAALKIETLASVTDKANLHRRDFNMLPQIFAGGASGFTVFSGVFRPDADLPFLDTVDIFADKHLVNKNFVQYLNHYHSAKVALYDAETRKTENIFFGGISQYEETAGRLNRDDDVPFVKTISKVTREKDGRMTETKIGEMPGYLGAGAEFLINPDLAKYDNEIIKLNEIRDERVLLGYIVGGISSSQKNIFWNNRGAESGASARIYKVWLVKSPLKEPAVKKE